MSIKTIAMRIAADFYGKYAYRIEDVEGKGPWSSRFHPHTLGIILPEEFEDENEEDMNFQRMPIPYDDFNREDYEAFKKGGDDYIFGFPTIFALRKWFSNRLLEGMLHAGMKIMRYEIDDKSLTPKVSKSRKQIIFIPKKGSEREIPWSEILGKLGNKSKPEFVQNEFEISSVEFTIDSDEERPDTIKRIYGIAKLNEAAKYQISSLATMQKIADWCEQNTPNFSSEQRNLLSRCVDEAKKVTQWWDNDEKRRFHSALTDYFGAERGGLPKSISINNNDNTTTIWSPVLHCYEKESY